MATRMAPVLDAESPAERGATVAPPPPVGPISPSRGAPSKPVALRGLVLGLVAAAVLFAGLALFGTALAWSSSMTTPTRAVLMVVGGGLVAAGLLYAISVAPRRAAHA